MGVCLRLSDQGVWTLRQGPTVLANGTMATPPASTWHTLRLDLHGSGAVAQVDSTVLTSSPVPVNATAGMASVGSGWHAAHFDNFSVVPN
eukprot:m.15649 g.15649  ORF g.15649 m.15649 type:complete len:90 (+) comp3298_c0_seq1:2463-2732(+)